MSYLEHRLFNALDDLEVCAIAIDGGKLHEENFEMIQLLNQARNLIHKVIIKIHEQEGRVTRIYTQKAVKGKQE